MSSESSQNNSHNSMSHEMRQMVGMMEAGISPRVILGHLAPSLPTPTGADDMTLWRLIFSMIEPPKRNKLTQYNTIDDAIHLIRNSNKIMVLSGAGISTSAGLPDFRSRNGIYVQINRDHPDLHDPKDMFDIDYFRKNPLPFYQFAKALYPGQYRPTVGHMFIKCLEDHKKLLRNYTQNIDTLERQAGITRAVECHGSFARATCTSCHYSADCETIRQDILNEVVPKCPACYSKDDGPRDGLGVMKPNIVFFGEQLGEQFHSSLEIDKEQVDLLIVIGSSLKVRPVALIPRSIPAHVPQILINREPLDHNCFDVELLGDCDGIIQELSRRLGESWSVTDSLQDKSLNEISGPPALKVLLSALDSRTGESNHSDTKREDDEETIIQETTDNERDQGLNLNDNPISANKDKADVSSEGQRAISNDVKIENNEEEWEDLQVIDSECGSPSSELDDKLDIEVPESSYLFIEPNKYMFPGVELTKNQIAELTKDLDSTDLSGKSHE